MSAAWVLLVVWGIGLAVGLCWHRAATREEELQEYQRELDDRERPS